MSKEPDMRRISNGKVVARKIEGVHTSFLTVANSITSNGAFYVNCSFNWIAGFALGGWILALGSVFNDFSMRDYWQRIKCKDPQSGACLAGFAVTATNSILSLFLCIFMFHDKLSNVDYAAVSSIKREIATLEVGMEFAKDMKQKQNWASTFQDWKDKNAELSAAEIKARGNADYAPEHAIFERTWLDKTSCLVFMCLAVFLNALISIWVKKEEVTVDDLDEHGQVIRKNGGISGLFNKLFRVRKALKPVVRMQAEKGSVVDDEEIDEKNQGLAYRYRPCYN